LKLLVTGGSSYLGRHLVPLALPGFSVQYTFFEHDPLALPNGRKLDIREKTAVTQLIHTFQPHVIIHTAGSNRGADMAAVIVEGTRHVTQAAAAVGARLIHLSTDSIFDGKAPPYEETAVPTPVNAYGRAKAHAEAIASRHPNHVIVRTSLIYSLEEMDHGTRWMAAALKAGKPVTLFNNQVRNPVWADALSRACLELAANNYTGVLNIAGRQVLTRAEFGLNMLDWWGVTPRDTLTIGPSLNDQWPLDCTLDLTRGTAVLQTPMPGVDEVLAQAKTIF
jgi:dTDP-4-dehydrorhamnose reductase